MSIAAVQLAEGILLAVMAVALFWSAAQVRSARLALGQQAAELDLLAAELGRWHARLLEEAAPWPGEGWLP